jgi:hypothetical protein
MGANLRKGRVNHGLPVLIIIRISAQKRCIFVGHQPSLSSRTSQALM